MPAPRRSPVGPNGGTAGGRTGQESLAILPMTTGMQTWIARRRIEFEHTSIALRLTGAVGWALVALIALDWVR